MACRGPCCHPSDRVQQVLRRTARRHRPLNRLPLFRDGSCHSRPRGSTRPPQSSCCYTYTPTASRSSPGCDHVRLYLSSGMIQFCQPFASEHTRPYVVFGDVVHPGIIVCVVALLRPLYLTSVAIVITRSNYVPVDSIRMRKMVVDQEPSRVHTKRSRAALADAARV